MKEGLQSVSTFAQIFEAGTGVEGYSAIADKICTVNFTTTEETEQMSLASSLYST